MHGRVINISEWLPMFSRQAVPGADENGKYKKTDIVNPKLI